MEFILNEDWRTMTARMYLKERRDGRSVIIGQKNGMLIEQVMDSMNPTVQEVVPLLEMNISFAKKFLEAVSDYNNSVGIKNENDNLLIGKLSATEKHLEDMRVGFTKVLDKLISVTNT